MTQPVLPGQCQVNACREKFQKDLQSLEQKRDLLAVDVPVDLLRAIDEGGNPDVFTAQIFEHANRANQLSKGKAEAFASFRCAPQSPWQPVSTTISASNPHE